MRKIPIGVFDPAFPDLSTDAMIEKFAGWGVEAVEIPVLVVEVEETKVEALKTTEEVEIMVTTEIVVMIAHPTLHLMEIK
jgi:sugar phosphate isomerase/epimerase